MQLIPNKRTKYGSFDLISEEGWKLYHFIDFSSKLLVVSEMLIDLSNIPTEFGVKTIPSRQYIIHQKKAKILTFEEWKAFFNYEEEVSWSTDGTLKETWLRKYNPQTNDDEYEGKLEQVAEGKILRQSFSVAFRADARQSLLEAHYKHLESAEKTKQVIAQSTQTCPHCGKKVLADGRYPRYICSECADLDKLDENGYRLEFYNEGISGGFLVYYYQDNQLMKMTKDEYEKVCYIEGKKYLATEARFGGIVIEKV
ncbi:MAG: hypothetical protein MUE85_02150 [Microscillaceae bacterium]|jgi:ribosomal protein S27AE|nr:hypothetical protein [Microscillaceae bacterium]